MGDSNGYQPPTELIVNAMSHLATEHALGHANGPKANLERMFQDRLCKLLNDMTIWSGWTWRREVRYQTLALRNVQTIAVDLLGQDRDGRHSAAIELKYVPTRQNGNSAPDPLAFPYDLLKDCLKIELLATAHSTPVNKDFARTPSFGYSIGLTNVPRILNGTMRGWSRNYLSALRAENAKEGARFSLGPCKIKSMPQKKTIEGVIFTNKRHNISLGKSWNGSWSQFGGTDFHFIMLSTDLSSGPPAYGHDIDDSHYIPFLTEQTRDDALQKAKDIRKISGRSSGV